MPGGGRMATGPEASWAALWPQRRFDTNTSNDSFVLAGFLSRRRHLHVYPLRSLNSPSCRIFVCREKKQPYTITKNGELICLLRDPKPCMQSRKSRCSQPKLANRPCFVFGCQLPRLFEQPQQQPAISTSFTSSATLHPYSANTA